MSVNTNNLPLSDLQNIYKTQQTILGDMRDNDILLPGMSADDFRKINKEIGKLNLEGGQPDPVGDAPSATSQFSSVDNALNDISLDRSIDARATLDTYGVTARDALDRARSLATYEDTLGVAVSTIGKIAGPTIANVVEALREDPRQSYREMIAPLAALDYYSKEPTYDLAQPTSAGKGTRAGPSTKNTFFGFDIDKKPVGTIPMSQVDQAKSDAAPDTGPVSSMTPSQQMETMSESKRSGIGESEGEEGAEQTSAEAEAASASYGGGFGGGHGPDTGMGAPDMGADMGWNTGGRVGALIQHLQTGGEAENADTNMEVANVPMGVVSDADGAPSPFSGGTGVEDDLEMEVDAGSYVLNAESVQLIGISDINAVIRDAYTIAVALGKEVPADYDPQNKVPIRISNGEAVIPKALVDIIGLDKLEKWNKKGLQLRKQKEKMMAQQQQQQPPQQQQVASEAPMQQQMGQLMDRGGEVGDFDIPMSQKEAQENLYPEEEIQKLQRLFRTDDSGPSKTGQPQSNINENITVEEEKNNVMAAQVGKIPVIPKSTFNRRKYTDNYDVVYGHDLYTPKLSKKKITRMTVKEIFANQDRLKKATEDETHTSTAHGPYQIIKPTLKSLMKNYKYDTNIVFTSAFQDNLATHLLDESGVFKFIEGEKDLNTVQNKLANIWAALPVSDEDKKSAHKNQKAALTSTEFREILKRVQELGETKGISLLLKTIRKAEAALR